MSVRLLSIFLTSKNLTLIFGLTKYEIKIAVLEGIDVFRT